MSGEPAGRPGRHVAAPPRFLDSILALAERIDRARMRLQPIHEGGLLELQLTRHHGREVALRDGTVVHHGDLIAILHIDNRALHDMEPGSGWQLAAMRRGREDLRALASWTARRRVGDRPVAYYGYSLLAPFGARVGFEVHEVPLTLWGRIVNWYLRGVMARWSSTGHQRLEHGRSDLHAREVWLSARTLVERYGTPAPR